jgi:hypothetical protein
VLALPPANSSLPTSSAIANSRNFARDHPSDLLKVRRRRLLIGGREAHKIDKHKSASLRDALTKPASIRCLVPDWFSRESFFQNLFMTVR